MDEALDLVELVADLGFSGSLKWLLRLLGLILVVAGIAVYLIADVGVVVPVLLVTAGMVLIVIPWLILVFFEAI